ENQVLPRHRARRGGKPVDRELHAEPFGRVEPLYLRILGRLEIVLMLVNRIHIDRLDALKLCRRIGHCRIYARGLVDGMEFEDQRSAHTYHHLSGFALNPARCSIASPASSTPCSSKALPITCR